MSHNFKDINQYLLARFRRIYFMALPESKEDYKKSRVNFTIGDSAAQTIVQLAGGTFLASLMTYCKISDADIGIITSLASLAALAQIFLIQFMSRIKKYKFLVCFTFLQRILFSAIYFIPFLDISNRYKAIAIIVLYFTGQIFVQIGTPASQDWIASLVPGRLRGKYFSIKDSIAVFIVSGVMLIAGMILDYFKANAIRTGFLIIGLLIFILVIINVAAMSMMKEPRISYLNEEGKEMHGRLAKKAKEKDAKKGKEKSSSILSEIAEAFKNRKFRKALILQSLYISGFYISLPFVASYQVNVLKLPYTFMMLVGFICNLYRIYITPKFGKMADKHGMAKILRYSLTILAFNILVLALTVPANAYPFFIIGTVLSSTAWAFVGIGLFGVQLDFFRSDKRMVWLSLVSSISGVWGFLVSIIGGKLLNIFTENPVTIQGVILYPQQILNILGFLILIGGALYIKLRIETEKIDTNRKDGRVSV
ncbi:MFS transporter [Anaerocolumna xylanovorans]|uniref:Major Facilitator Superfamily protein n=1 Tax=Anaerocolumna xylanovorans DSM 12503 TaxID=1121345 RepID=A0A1M7YD87_9FIRM|nr:MFS transporter [Anaerocolumna xylanovorans]SHO50612.1 Major Facilitator Superfamily protein [Anaerocolumna xylanovorans DSM 12503]